MSEDVRTHRFEAQPQTPEEAEEWILVLMEALQNRSNRWRLKVVYQPQEHLYMECGPTLSNEAAARVYLRRKNVDASQPSEPDEG